MAQVALEDDAELVERFESMFRRRPGRGELVRLRAAEAGIRLRMPRRARRRAARLIARS